MGDRTDIHESVQILELSQVVGHNDLRLVMEEEASLQFQETFSALSQLTSLHLSNVRCMAVLPAGVFGSMTNLRYISHRYTVCCFQRGSAARAFARVSCVGIPFRPICKL